MTAVVASRMGSLFLFAPIQRSCRVTATSTVPGQLATPGPTICERTSLFQSQPIWPLPFFAPFVLLPLRITTAIALASRPGGRELEPLR